MSEQRDRFEKRIEALVAQVEEWSGPQELVTKRYPKRMRDVDRQIFEVPALYLQKGPIRVLLDPLAYDLPEAEAAVDLYLMPTYDDLARLFLEHGGWVIHYAFPAGPGQTNSATETQTLPLSAETINQVLDSIAAHAVPSV